MTMPQKPSTPCPCEGLDPFCETCVPFGRHLDPGIPRQQRAVGDRIARLGHQVASHITAGRPVPKPDECRAFAEGLTAAREAAGLTLGQLAYRAGIGVEELQAIEAGRPWAGMKIPEPSTVLRLRWALGKE